MPMSEEKIAKIGEELAKDAEVSSNKQVEREFDAKTASNFSSAMEAGVAANKQAAAAPHTTQQNAPAVMDLASQVYQNGSGQTLNKLSSIEETTKAINEQIVTIKQTLNQPEQAIKKAYEPLLENKLEHIDDSLRVALEKSGLEYTPSAPTAGAGSAIEKFLGYLTKGQSQIERLGDEITNLRGKGKEIHPADLLAVQYKVGFVQQELYLFSNLLNKGLESTKTLLNVQV